jgi:hypothetical protein
MAPSLRSGEGRRIRPVLLSLAGLSYSAPLLFSMKRAISRCIFYASTLVIVSNTPDLGGRDIERENKKKCSKRTGEK